MSSTRTNTARFLVALADLMVKADDTKVIRKSGTPAPAQRSMSEEREERLEELKKNMETLKKVRKEMQAAWVEAINPFIHEWEALQELFEEKEIKELTRLFHETGKHINEIRTKIDEIERELKDYENKTKSYEDGHN